MCQMYLIWKVTTEILPKFNSLFYYKVGTLCDNTGDGHWKSSMLKHNLARVSTFFDLIDNPLLDGRLVTRVNPREQPTEVASRLGNVQ